MKLLLSLCLILCLAAGAAFGQAGLISVFSDPGGTSCQFIDTPGVTNLYVVHVNTPGATAGQFAICEGAGFTCDYLAETYPFPTVIGNTRTGITVGYGGCQASPILMVTMLYICDGSSLSCSTVEVIPDPAEVTGEVVVTDCVVPFPNKLTAAAGRIITNPTIDCNCLANASLTIASSNPCTPPLATQKSTWGSVKALYR